MMKGHGSSTSTPTISMDSRNHSFERRVRRKTVRNQIGDAATASTDSLGNPLARRGTGRSQRGEDRQGATRWSIEGRHPREPPASPALHSPCRLELFAPRSEFPARIPVRLPRLHVVYSPGPQRCSPQGENLRDLAKPHRASDHRHRSKKERHLHRGPFANLIRVPKQTRTKRTKTRARHLMRWRARAGAVPVRNGGLS